MDWEQKFAALKSLSPLSSDCAVFMRKPGSWYVTLGSIEIGGDGVLTMVSGDGDTPRAAIEDAWERVTSLGPNRYLVLNAGSDARRHVRWNGFMWAEVPKAA
jgi:hypothetical protein